MEEQKLEINKPAPKFSAEVFHNNEVKKVNLDQYKGKNGAEDQFPHPFYPQMHYPPPPVLIHYQVGRVIEGEQEKHRQAPQAD